MAKFCTILILCSLLIAGTYATSRKEAKEAEKWFQNLSQLKEKVAKLHFYVQDALGGPNATIWEVARAEITSVSPTMFGQVRVLDDLITAEPDRNSEKLGRAQGLITSADLRESGLAMNINFVFTAGEYNGSTLCILGRNPIDSRNRELPVVGGTGVFRMAYTVYVSYVEGWFGTYHTMR
ncbi:hypothetical protein Pfo_023819 [Paulownia fortunei]|nr:hypothetical protein Pfo_023819 [Paulownia fortunei]